MLMNFQPEAAYRRHVEWRDRVARKCQLDWLHYLEQQSQLANLVLAFALAISVGAVIGYILLT
jgi:hypothetical protein